MGYKDVRMTLKYDFWYVVARIECDEIKFIFATAILAIMIFKRKTLDYFPISFSK